MTPLAKFVAGQSIDQRRWWRDNGYHKLLAPFPDKVKCFDVGQVKDLAHMLADKATETGTIAEARAFLPAPATWLEFPFVDGKNRGRAAYLLVQKDETCARCVSVVGVDIGPGTAIVPMPLGDLPLLSAADADGFALDSVLVMQQLPARHGSKWDASKVDWDQALFAEQWKAYELYAYLSLINSPNIVSRNERSPPSGLGKRLARREGKPFQLLPWHEILLDIAPPDDSHEPHGTRLSGPKALHFCRQHIRIRLGRLEYVRAHFRGNPALGIAQGKYMVGTRTP